MHEVKRDQACVYLNGCQAFTTCLHMQSSVNGSGAFHSVVHDLLKSVSWSKPSCFTAEIEKDLIMAV